MPYFCSVLLLLWYDIIKGGGKNRKSDAIEVGGYGDTKVVKRSEAKRSRT